MLSDSDRQTIEWYAKEVPALPQGNYELVTVGVENQRPRAEYYSVDEDGCVKQLFGKPIFYSANMFYMVRPREVPLVGFDRELALLKMTDALFHRAACVARDPLDGE